MPVPPRSRDRRTLARILPLAALALAGATSRAHAADFDGPYPPPDGAYERRLPPPPPEEVYRAPRFTAAPPPYAPPPRFEPPPRFARPDGCRTFVRRRFDPDGEPVLRRVQVCDEPAGYRLHRFPRPDFDGPGLDRPHVERPPVPPADVPFDGPRRDWGGPRW